MALGDISLMLHNHNKSEYEKMAKATVKNVVRVNNEEYIEVSIEATERNMKILKNVDKRWGFEVSVENLFTFDTIQYVITNVSDNMGFGNSPVELVAIRWYIDELKRSMVYTSSDGSMTFKNRVLYALSGSSYSVSWAGLDDTFLYATTMQGFGYASSWELLNRVVDFYGVEYSVDETNKIIRFTNLKGVDRSESVRYSVNLVKLLRQRDLSGFATYGRAFGAWKDDENHALGRYEAAYMSPLSSVYGIIPLNPPVVDERFTIVDSLYEEVKRRVLESIIDSTEVDIDSLSFTKLAASRQLNVGDRILLIDSSSVVRENVRVVEMSKTYSEFGEMIDVVYTIGNYSQEYRNNKKNVAVNKLV